MRTLLILIVIFGFTCELQAQFFFNEDQKLHMTWKGTKYYFNTDNSSSPIWNIEMLISNETDEDLIIDFKDYLLLFDIDASTRKLSMEGIGKLELKKGTSITLTFGIDFDNNYPYSGTLSEKLNYINNFSFDSIFTLMHRTSGRIKPLSKWIHNTKYYDNYEMINLED